MTTLAEATSPAAGRDPYRGAVIVLAAASILGSIIAAAAGVNWGNRVLLDLAVTLAIGGGLLAEVALTRSTRTKTAAETDYASTLALLNAGDPPADVPHTKATSPSRVADRLASAATWLSNRFQRFRRSDTLGPRTAVCGLAAGWLVLFFNRPLVALTSQMASIAAGACVLAAVMTAVATRYLTQIDETEFPEAPGLAQGARVVGWTLILAVASIGLAWVGQPAGIQVIHVALLALNVALCVDLFMVKRSVDDGFEGFVLNAGVIAVLGSRANVLASALDAAEQQLGIDLRSTWALTVVRQSLEPLVVGLFLLGWLSTSLTVVGPGEQGLIERLGVPVRSDALLPGLHLHWPWPVDRVFRIPVRRVQDLTVGHEGVEESGPENVLWAVQHAPNEYTLLLGDGRDLVVVDASVQYHITDPRAWRYHSQNPADALKAIAYRAVMRNTVNKTLAEALSENVVSLTQRMRTQVQEEADALGLGVEILGFTVGGMHPPVAVASDYQAVVSAALRKVTRVVDAQAYRNGVVPRAESRVVEGTNIARAEGASAVGRAIGEASSFVTLQSQYRVDPREFLFRRRLEMLEKDLTGRTFTVVDSRFQRDGGELWVNP